MQLVLVLKLSQPYDFKYSPQLNSVRLIDIVRKLSQILANINKFLDHEYLHHPVPPLLGLHLALSLLNYNKAPNLNHIIQNIEIQNCQSSNLYLPLELQNRVLFTRKHALLIMVEKVKVFLLYRCQLFLPYQSLQLAKSLALQLLKFKVYLCFWEWHSLPS